MLDGFTPDLAPRLVIAVGGVALAFVALIVVLMFMKKRNSPLFIKGGRARDHRLHVLDAAAVDTKRRLVLIRRDNIEHLIMIGGPTDIVIETGIGGERASAPVAIEAITAAHPAPMPAPAPVQAAVAQPAPRPVEHPRPAAPPREAAPRPAPAPAPAPAAPERPQQRSQAPMAIAPQPAAPAPQPATPQPASAAAARGISEMGAMLYDEGREPFSGAKPDVKPAQPAAVSPQRPTETVVAPPTASQAESILDLARNRVLSPGPATTPDVEPQMATKLDASRAEAARLEAARADAYAKLEAARQANAPTRAPEPRVDPPVGQSGQSQDRLASDFASFLEAELEAGGILSDGAASPGVRPERREPAPLGRATPTLTGAQPTPTTEQEMARRLGEIQLQRKADSN